MRGGNNPWCFGAIHSCQVTLEPSNLLPLGAKWARCLLLWATYRIGRQVVPEISLATQRDIVCHAVVKGVPHVGGVAGHTIVVDISCEVLLAGHAHALLVRDVGGLIRHLSVDTVCLVVPWAHHVRLVCRHRLHLVKELVENDIVEAYTVGKRDVAVVGREIALGRLLQPIIRIGNIARMVDKVIRILILNQRLDCVCIIRGQSSGGTFAHRITQALFAHCSEVHDDRHGVGGHVSCAPGRVEGVSRRFGAIVAVRVIHCVVVLCIWCQSTQRDVIAPRGAGSVGHRVASSIVCHRHGIHPIVYGWLRHFSIRVPRDSDCRARLSVAVRNAVLERLVGVGGHAGGQQCVFSKAPSCKQDTGLHSLSRLTVFHFFSFSPFQPFAFAPRPILRPNCQLKVHFAARLYGMHPIGRRGI